MSKPLTDHAEMLSASLLLPLSPDLQYPILPGAVHLLSSSSPSLGVAFLGLVLLVDPFTGLSPGHSKEGYTLA